ncbi:MAG TPA: bifunctional nuclease family protein [Paludibacteraceae bacterium]|jgi:bifunctional DNase/RNase|nr:bifunctional nuclease family protein [Paludibacteraceae bacterium]HPS10385.1 bifunctional nuclease family protein [Paludibacteraceae bacterium]
MTNEIRLHISGMVYNQALGGTYSLVLTEDSGQKRRFSVLIGESEAQSIALKLNNAKSPRPLSHDLMNSIINMLEAKLLKVVIYDMVNDIFYSELYLLHAGKSIVVDARTSDAVALAVRSNAPIYINSDILDIVGTVIEPEADMDDKSEMPASVSLDNLTNDILTRLPEAKLQELLDQAIKEERYEMAAMIRDEMEYRKHH